MSEETSPDTPVQGERKVKTYIAWLTGILLGIPALINVRIDVYDSIKSKKSIKDQRGQVLT